MGWREQLKEVRDVVREVASRPKEVLFGEPKKTIKPGVKFIPGEPGYSELIEKTPSTKEVFEAKRRGVDPSVIVSERGKIKKSREDYVPGDINIEGMSPAFRKSYLAEKAARQLAEQKETERIKAEEQRIATAKAIEKERQKKLFEANQKYQRDLKRIHTQKERQERVNQLQQQINNIQREAQFKRVEKGVASSVNIVSGGYQDKSGRYIKRTTTRVTTEDLKAKEEAPVEKLVEVPKKELSFFGKAEQWGREKITYPISSVIAKTLGKKIGWKSWEDFQRETQETGKRITAWETGAERQKKLDKQWTDYKKKFGSGLKKMGIELPKERPKPDLTAGEIYKFVGGVGAGGIRGLKEKPIKTIATTAAFAALPGALGAVSKVGKVVGIGKLATKAPVVTSLVEKGISYGLPAFYGVSVARRVGAAETPYGKGYVAGEIGTTEIAPMLVGSLIGTQTIPKVIERIKTIGREEIPISTLVPQEVIVGKKTFPTAASKKHLKIFKERGVTYHATPKEWDSMLTGVGSSELPGTYVSSYVSPHFLKVAGETRGFAPKLFTTPSSPKVMKIIPKGFTKGKWIKVKPYKLNGQTFRYKWVGKAKKGIIEIPQMKTEIEGVIRANTLLTKIKGKYYFKWKGHRIPVDSFSIVTNPAGQVISAIPKVPTSAPQISKTTIKELSSYYKATPSYITTPETYALASLISKPSKTKAPSRVSKVTSPRDYLMESITSIPSYKPTSKVVSKPSKRPKPSKPSSKVSSVIDYMSPSLAYSYKPSPRSYKPKPTSKPYKKPLGIYYKKPSKKKVKKKDSKKGRKYKPLPTAFEKILGISPTARARKRIYSGFESIRFFEPIKKRKIKKKVKKK